ncbi:MAG: hypothetical protein J2O48_07535, partial [Solirubrobacterales bacterium]|nr:hypothetical protein [Solirubrobacterales bacterium]
VVARSRGLSELADEGFATAVAPEAEPAQVASVISDALSRPGPDKVPELSSWDDCAAALLSMYQQVTLEAVHK